MKRLEKQFLILLFEYNRKEIENSDTEIKLREKLKGNPLAARGHFLEAERALKELEENLPEPLKESYLWDRKSDRIRRELENLPDPA